MSNDSPYSRFWKGKSLSVSVLYSKAGYSQHILIESTNCALLFDTGDGILRDLKSDETDSEKIQAIFYTHGHFDHMGGLYPLLGFMRMIGRKNELHIFAPENCGEVIGMVEIFRDLYPDTIPFKIIRKDACPGEIYRFGDMEIHPFQVVHCGSVADRGILDPIPAAGYRIVCAGETVAISGDTGDCESLRDNMRGADLAIIEATYATSEEATDDQLKKVHLSEDLATEIGRTAGEFLLVHPGRR